MRGRTQGILTVVLIGGPQVANVVHGMGSALIGPRWTIGLGSALAVAAVVLVLWRLPQLWHYLPAPGPHDRARDPATARG